MNNELIVSGNVTVGGSSLDTKINSNITTVLGSYYTQAQASSLMKNSMTNLSGTAATVPVVSWVGNAAYVSQICSSSAIAQPYFNLGNLSDPLICQIRLGLNAAVSAANGNYSGAFKCAAFASMGATSISSNNGLNVIGNVAVTSSITTHGTNVRPYVAGRFNAAGAILNTGNGQHASWTLSRTTTGVTKITSGGSHPSGNGYGVLLGVGDGSYATCQVFMVLLYHKHIFNSGCSYESRLSLFCDSVC